MSIDRIDAYKALSGARCIPASLSIRLYNGELSIGMALIPTSTCGCREVALYRGDYWPVLRDKPGVGPYIQLQEQTA